MNTVFDQAQSFTRLWLQCVGKMTSAGMSIDPTSSPPDLTRHMRSATLQTMAEMTEQWMRSPEYLAFMKQTMDATVSFRKQMNDFMTHLHHETQGTARQDIDTVLASVKHMETRVLCCMEQMTARLESIGQRLETLEDRNNQGNGEKERIPSPAPNVPAERPPRRQKERTAEKPQE